MPTQADARKFIQLIDQVHESICKGAVSLNLSRFDSKDSPRYPLIYDKDQVQFKVKAVSAFIREAHCGEFDYTPSTAYFDETFPELPFQKVDLPNDVLKAVHRLIPRLWVLVENRGEGMHHVSTLYRGPAIWKVIEFEGRQTAVFSSNSELNQALAKVQSCHGFDVKAWKVFMQHYWDACVLEAAVVPENCGVIN